MMAGSNRSSTRLCATAARTLGIVAFTSALAACSGDNGGAPPHGAVGDPRAYQDPPGNPQEALLNGEVPLGNPEQPPGNPEQPLPNPEQPSTAGGSGIAGVTAQCTAFCGTFAATCSAACNNGCGQLASLSPVCLDAFSRFLGCVLGGPIVCGRNGRLEVDMNSVCLDESRAVISCVNGAVTAVPPPGNGRMMMPNGGN